MALKCFRNIIGLMLLLGLFVFGARAQTKTDSLFMRLKIEKNENKQFDIYTQLSLELLKTDLIKALEYAQKALEIADDIGDAQMQGKSITNLGNAYLSYGKYDKALNCFLKAYDIAQNLQDTNKIIKLSNNMGVLYALTSNHNKAFVWYNRALFLLKSIPNSESDKELYANVYNNIGNIYNEKKMFDSAAVYYKKGIEVNQHTPYISILATCYNNLSLIYLKNSNVDSAFYCIKKNIDLRKQINDRRGLCRAFQIISDYYDKVNNSDSSLYYTIMAFNLANETHDLLEVSNVAKRLSNFFDKLNLADSALKYHQLYTLYKDSVYSENSRNEFSRIEMEYKLQKQEVEYKAAQLKKEFLYIISLITLCSIVIIVTLLFFFVRNKQKQTILQKKNLELQHNNLLLEKQTLQNDLEHRNKELTTNIMYLVQKNELINDVSKELLEIKNRVSKDSQKEIQSAIMHLQLGAKDSFWDEFDYRFNQVHQDFYEKLRSNYPDLTPLEIKLCAFLRLNLSSKEIADITHQNIRAIESARYRLRKKLNIANSEINLVNFIMDL